MLCMTSIYCGVIPMAEKWKKFTCLPNEGKTRKKSIYIECNTIQLKMDEVLPSVTKWMELNIIMKSETSHAQEAHPALLHSRKDCQSFCLIAAESQMVATGCWEKRLGKVGSWVLCYS